MPLTGHLLFLLLEEFFQDLCLHHNQVDIQSLTVLLSIIKERPMTKVEANIRFVKSFYDISDDARGMIITLAGVPIVNRKLRSVWRIASPNWFYTQWLIDPDTNINSAIFNCHVKYYKEKKERNAEHRL